MASSRGNVLVHRTLTIRSSFSKSPAYMPIEGALRGTLRIGTTLPSRETVKSLTSCRLSSTVPTPTYPDLGT